MGFTPLDGLVMGTRSGSVDPGLLLWLLERSGLSVEEVSNALERESGLLGLAGTADMREVLERAKEGDPEAVLARDVYVHHLRAGMGAMVAAMEGLDVLVFTGRVGGALARDPRGRRSRPFLHRGLPSHRAKRGSHWRRGDRLGLGARADLRHHSARGPRDRPAGPSSAGLATPSAPRAPLAAPSRQDTIGLGRHGKS